MFMLLLTVNSRSEQAVKLPNGNTALLITIYTRGRKSRRQCLLRRIVGLPGKILGEIF